MINTNLPTAKFSDRREAGKLLGEEIMRQVQYKNMLLLVIPNGGMPVGFEVAKKLELPLYVFTVRKFGVIGNEEHTLGALTSGDICALNKDTIKKLKISKDNIEILAKQQMSTFRHLDSVYKNFAPPYNEMSNRDIILVDDGMVSGATINAAIVALRRRYVKKIIVAVPVAKYSVYNDISKKVDKVICLSTPTYLNSLKQIYRNFNHINEEESKNLLELINTGKELPL